MEKLGEEEKSHPEKDSLVFRKKGERASVLGWGSREKKSKMNGERRECVLGGDGFRKNRDKDKKFEEEEAARIKTYIKKKLEESVVHQIYVVCGRFSSTGNGWRVSGRCLGNKRPASGVVGLFAQWRRLIQSTPPSYSWLADNFVMDASPRCQSTSLGIIN